MSEQTPAGDDSKIVVGRLHGAHGVKGWNKLQSFTASPEDIANYPHWFIRATPEESWRKAEWEELRWQGKKLVTRLKQCQDRNQADALAGHEIAIAATELPELAQDEYYWHQLVGLNVIIGTGQHTQILGVVTDLLETGANDVLVVRGKGCAEALDERERLIPYLPEQVVQHVDLAAGTVQVDWDPEF